MAHEPLSQTLVQFTPPISNDFIAPLETVTPACWTLGWSPVNLSGPGVFIPSAGGEQIDPSNDQKSGHVFWKSGKGLFFT